MIAQSNAQFLPYLNTEVFVLRLANLACTRLIRRFLYSEATRGECISGQHTDCFHILLAVLSNRRADRFFLWWLFLHRRLRSRQRGSFCNERLSCFLAVPFQKVSFVFIRTTRKVLRLFSASLSASMQGVNSSFFPSFAALKTMRHRVCLPIPAPVERP